MPPAESIAQSMNFIAPQQSYGSLEKNALMNRTARSRFKPTTFDLQGKGITT
uniref:Uncharacterized protein n=1 Tax=Arion vulgaris TaxID=1028688 RepID=A0A0B7AAS7_9EUPU